MFDFVSAALRSTRPDAAVVIRGASEAIQRRARDSSSDPARTTRHSHIDPNDPDTLWARGVAMNVDDACTYTLVEIAEYLANAPRDNLMPPDGVVTTAVPSLFPLRPRLPARTTPRSTGRPHSYSLTPSASPRPRAERVDPDFVLTPRTHRRSQRCADASTGCRLPSAPRQHGSRR